MKIIGKPISEKSKPSFSINLTQSMSNFSKGAEKLFKLDEKEQFKFVFGIKGSDLYIIPYDEKMKVDYYIVKMFHGKWDQLRGKLARIEQVLEFIIKKEEIKSIRFELTAVRNKNIYDGLCFRCDLTEKRMMNNKKISY